MVLFRCLVLAVALATGATSASTDSLPTPSEHLTIVAFGSSSTQGVGASSRAASYPAQLAALLRKSMPIDRNVAVMNRGIGGDDAEDMALRLQKDVIAPRPHLVIWQTGSNDPMTHNPLPTFERQTREGIAAMQANGIEVILMEPQWAPALERIAVANAYRDIVRKVGAEMRVVVIRRSDLMHHWIESRIMTKAEMMSPDGLHMGDKGYAALARFVADEIRKTRAYKRVPATQLALDDSRTRS